MLEKLGQYLQGKKTFLTAVAVGVCAVLQFYGIVIPEYVWAILGAAGLGFLRSGISKSGPK